MDFTILKIWLSVMLFIPWSIVHVHVNLFTVAFDLPSAKNQGKVTSDNIPTPIRNIGGGIIILHGIFPVIMPGKIEVRINGKIALITSSLQFLIR